MTDNIYYQFQKIICEILNSLFFWKILISLLSVKTTPLPDEGWKAAFEKKRKQKTRSKQI